MGYYEKLMGTAEVANKLHVTQQTVCVLIRKGKLKAVDLSNGNKRPRWGVSEEDLEAFRHGNICAETKTVEPDLPKEEAKPVATLTERSEIIRVRKEMAAMKEQIAILTEKLLDLCAEFEGLTK